MLALVSLGVMALLTPIDASAAFYLYPSRAWELGLGVMCAYLLAKPAARATLLAHSQWRSSLALLGKLLIVIAMFGLGAQLTAPYIPALLACSGTACLIIGGAGTLTWPSKLLAMPVLVGIGLISYSVYFWHQPLLAFYRYQYGEPGTQDLLLVWCGTFALAFLTWRLVERPARQAKGRVRSAVTFSCLLTLLGLGAAGAYASTQHGMLSRFDPAQRAVLHAGVEARHTMEKTAFDRGRCFLDFHQDAAQLVTLACHQPTATSGRILWFGDSEAAHYSQTALQHVSKPVVQWTSAACRPLEGLTQSSRCQQFVESFWQHVAPTLTAADTVVLSANWQSALRQAKKKEFTAAVKQTLQQLAARGVKVIVFGNMPDFPHDPYETVIKQGLAQQQTISLMTSSYKASDAILSHQAQLHQVVFYSPANVLCDHQRPTTAGPWCRFKDQDGYLFYDTGHLSPRGAKRVLSLFNQW